MGSSDHSAVAQRTAVHNATARTVAAQNVAPHTVAAHTAAARTAAHTVAARTASAPSAVLQSAAAHDTTVRAETVHRVAARRVAARTLERNMLVVPVETQDEGVAPKTGIAPVPGIPLQDHDLNEQLGLPIAVCNNQEPVLNESDNNSRPNAGICGWHCKTSCFLAVTQLLVGIRN